MTALPAVLASALFAAQPADARPIEEVVADLAYGYCPLYLAGQFPLADNPRLERDGFAATVERTEQAGVGTIEAVKTELQGGEVSFGGLPDRLCNVTVRGDRREAVLARLRRDLGLSGVQYTPVPAQSGLRSGVTVETFKGRVDPQTMLNIQFLQAGGATPMLAVQVYATVE